MTALPHDLCACRSCVAAARRILLDGYLGPRTTTEPERRRAAGEEAFSCSDLAMRVGRTFLHDAIIGHWGDKEARRMRFARECVSALLRALVLQALLETFLPSDKVTR